MRKFVLWMSGLVVVISLLGFPGRAGAQNVVMPTLLPAPPGKLTIVNNGPGDQTDPHVSGNLVSYSSAVGTAVYTVRYFDLTIGLDAGIPQGSGIYINDYLSDVSSSTVVFIRASAPYSSVFSFDTATAGAQPVEVSPTVNASRTNPQIGGNTIAWEDFGNVGSNFGQIIAYDIPTGATTLLSNDPTPKVNQALAASPDGSVITWEKCTNPGAPCDIWSAIGGGTTWVLHQLTNGNGACKHPDTNGHIVLYACDRGSGDQFFWQPATGGTEQTLAPVLANESYPAIAGQFVSFAGLAPGAPNHDLYVLDLSTLNLYQITNTPLADEQLNDISITPNGNVNVAWTVYDSNTAKWNVYAYTFNLPVGDFNLGAISPLTIAAGGSGSANLEVNPVNGFSSAVSLSVTGQPAGVTATLTPNQVTPSGGTPASSVLNVNISPALAPANFTLTVAGTSGTLTHSATAEVTVTATTSSIGNLIGDLLGAGCIDNGGIANALTSKLSAAQGAANTQTAINTLTALKNQINAQAGKHIATTCNIGGVAFNPVTVLLLDVQGLIDSLRVSTIPDPITGYVVDMNGVGVPSAAASILDANGNAIATATTDITGFYFMATTGVLTPNAGYTLQVTGLPAGFTSAAPANQTFTWQGSSVALSNFVLN